MRDVAAILKDLSETSLSTDRKALVLKEDDETWNK